MISKNVIFVVFVIFLISLENANGWRTFWKGRRRDGNLMHPHVNETKYQLPEDEWFEQKLDHFNDSSTTTWKQVSHTFSRAALYDQILKMFLYL